MKKVIQLFLCTFLIGFPVFAGGGQQSAGQGGAGGKMVLTMAMWELSQVGGDAVGDYIENKFNVDIQPIMQEWGDYQETFRLWAAANQLPDTWSGYPMEQPWFAEFVDQGLVRTIPESMIAKYPNVKRIVDSNALSQTAKARLGDYYYIPRVESAKGYLVSGNLQIYYRKDWAEKLGFKDRPRDMDAFYNMLKAFVDSDPDGNGRKDTYGITAGELTNLYYPFGAFPGHWVNSGGRAIPGWADERPMIEALTWLRKAHNAGIIDPELPSDYTMVASKFMQDTFGAMIRTVNAYWINRHTVEQFGGTHPGVDPLKAVDNIAILSARAGGKAYGLPYQDASGIVFNADLPDAKLDKFLAIYDWLVSDEGNALRYWGIKDVDYRVNSDGSFTKIGNDDLRAKYPSIFIQNWPTWDFDFNADSSPSYSQAVKDAAMALHREANTATENIRAIWNQLAGIAITEEKNLFEVQGLPVEASLNEIVMGTGDVTAMYRAFIAEQNNRGLQRVIESVNAAIK